MEKLYNYNASKVCRLFAKSVQTQSTPNPAFIANADIESVARCGLPWLELDIAIPFEIISNEIKNIEHLLVPHRTEYNSNTGWSSFCIHGKSYDSTKEDAHYNDFRPYTWTSEALELMPQTVNFFRSTWPSDDYLRLRVMKLSAGASIEVHRDEKPGRMYPVNIAITQPENCNFYIENFGVVPFAPGKAFWLDIGHRHCVINDSDKDRYHIIVHHKNESKEFENLVLRSYNRLYDNS